MFSSIPGLSVLDASLQTQPSVPRRAESPLLGIFRLERGALGCLLLPPDALGERSVLGWDRSNPGHTGSECGTWVRTPCSILCLVPVPPNLSPREPGNPSSREMGTGPSSAVPSLLTCTSSSPQGPRLPPENLQVGAAREQAGGLAAGSGANSLQALSSGSVPG